MTTPPIRRFALLLACAALAGCAADIRPDDFGQGGPLTEELTPTGPVTTGQNLDGTFTTIIDATSDKEWTYLDFDTRAETAADGPWDVRYQRFHISANGGVSGPGGVEVTAIADRTFGDVTSPPAAGWLTDAPDGDDVNFEPDYAFEQGDGWYSYSLSTHVLTPRPVVRVVRSPDGPTVKLRIERYYDGAGTPGWVKLRWAPL